MRPEFDKDADESLEDTSATASGIRARATPLVPEHAGRRRLDEQTVPHVGLTPLTVRAAKATPYPCINPAALRVMQPLIEEVVEEQRLENAPTTLFAPAPPKPSAAPLRAVAPPRGSWLHRIREAAARWIRAVGDW